MGKWNSKSVQRDATLKPLLGSERGLYMCYKWLMYVSICSPFSAVFNFIKTADPFQVHIGIGGPFNR